ncbi:uncharacterized protein LOC118198408 [Stegodyphus dumicola]|nr:uncharacterized protein LOC118198408 [Stegodyphus dumicola]
MKNTFLFSILIAFMLSGESVKRTSIANTSVSKHLKSILNPQISSIYAKAKNVKERTIRELVRPVASNRQPVREYVLPAPDQRPQIRPRNLQHQGFQSVAVSNIFQPRSQKYHQAFALPQGPVLPHVPSDPRGFRNINNRPQDVIRSQFVIQRNPHLPRTDRIIERPPHEINMGRERPVIPNHMIPAISAPRPYPGSPDILPSSDTSHILRIPERKTRPPKNRVIEVYHHIPVPGLNTRVQPKIPAVVYLSQNPIHSLKSAEHSHEALKQTTIPQYMVSDQRIIPQRFSSKPSKNPMMIEYSGNDHFHPELTHETVKSVHLSHRHPISLHSASVSEVDSPFETEFVENIAVHGDRKFPENVKKIQHKKQINLFTRKPDISSEQNSPKNKNSNPLESKKSESVLPKDLIISGKLRIVPTVVGHNLNRSVNIKKYWDFREMNAHEIPHPQVMASSSPKSVSTDQRPVFSYSSNNYQGQESIASLSVKDHSKDNSKAHNSINEDQPDTKFDNLDSIDGSSNLMLQPFSSKPHDHQTSVQNLTNLPAYSVSEDAKATTRNPMEIKKHNSRAKIQVSKSEQATDSHRPTTATIRNLNPIRKSTQAPKYIITNIPKWNSDEMRIPVIEHKGKYGQKRTTTERPSNNQYILQANPQSKWAQNLKYAAVEAFRSNIQSTPSTTISTSYSPNSYKNKSLSSLYLKPKVIVTQIPDSSLVSQSNFDHKNQQMNSFEITEQKLQASVIQSHDRIESNTEVPKQYFRGPQHIITPEEISTTISNRFENQFTSERSFYIPTTKPSQRKITPTVVPARSVTHRTQQSMKQNPVSSSTKVNTLHLSNRVFGRRNFTMRQHTTPSTSEKPTFTSHKFLFQPVTKSTPKDEGTSTTESDNRKLVFNFRTGAMDSVPQPASSAVPKVTYYLTENYGFKARPTTENVKTDFSSSLQPTKSGIGSFQLYESLPNATSKGLYMNLKPVTKPYKSYSTPSTSTLSSKVTEIIKAPTIRIRSTTPKSISKNLQDDQKLSVATKAEPRSTTSVPKSTKLLSHYSKPTTIITTSFQYDSNKPTTTTMQHSATTIKSVKELTENVTSYADQEPQTSLTLDIYTNQTELSDTEVTTEMDKYATTISILPTPSNISSEVTTEAISQEQMIVDSLRSMKLKMQEMMSKGLRHLMPLVMGLSSDVNISSDCTFSLLRWLRGVRALEPWAIRMMDASSKVPEGILFGTFSTFGSYDECIAIKTPKTNLQMPFTGQYCSINIQPNLPQNERHFTIHNAFRKYPKLKQVFQEMNIEEDTMAYYYILKHRIGICMPSTCSMSDLNNVTETLADHLKMKISVGHCETSEKPSLTKGQIISMCGVFITFGIVILATITDILIRLKAEHEMDFEDIVRRKSALRHFSYLFSAYGNACKILDTSIPVNHISSIHGIKFLSITWIMLGHVYYCKDYLTLAGLNKVRDLGANLAFQVVLNSGFAADTFFFLSGLLVVYSTFHYLESNDGSFTIVGFYIRRYCRLTPAFLMISGVILLGPLAGSGPIWNETLEPFVSGCQNYWWTNLFYFSNFMPTSITCVPHGWFLSCDMQFYVISPVIILALYRHPKMGLLFIALGIFSSMATTGFLTFIYNLPPVSLFSLPDPKDINEYLDTVGYKPYAHYASYCIGMATGFLLAAKQKISISKCVQVCGWTASTICCILVVYGTWNWNSGDLPDWEVSVAYATTSRTVWALGIAWLTIICYSGRGGIVNDILSWHGFIPLSRLSYLAYLIHPLLMYLYASYVRAPFYFSQYVLVYLYLGHLCVTFGLAFLFSLAFEVPFLNLEKVVSKCLDQNKRKRRASFSNHHNNWQHPEHPELKDSVVLMRRRSDKFTS